MDLKIENSPAAWQAAQDAICALHPVQRIEYPVTVDSTTPVGTVAIEARIVTPLDCDMIERLDSVIDELQVPDSVIAQVKHRLCGYEQAARELEILTDRVFPGERPRVGLDDASPRQKLLAQAQFLKTVITVGQHYTY